MQTWNNIAFSKIGKSIKFASKFSPCGGDIDAPNMIRLLANNNPDKTFYIVGKSDFRKLSDEQRIKLFPYGNVIDVWENTNYKVKKDNVYHVSKYFAKKGFQPDVHIAMIGQIGTVTIPDKIKQIGDPSLTAAVIDMTLGYSSPIIEWMNDNQDIPIIEVVCDPRYTLRQSRDIIPNPYKTLSQYEYTYTKSTIRSYQDQTRDDHKIYCTYNEIEKLFLYDRDGPNKNRDRNTNFMVVLNEGSPSRYDMLNQWVLQNINDVEIYGRWEHEKAVSDSRFKGSMDIEELQKKLSDVKCTFIIPIEKGWVTSKYIEMIQAGVIPIFHPTYDEQNHLNYPEIFKPKTVQEMLSLVNKISTDNEFYCKAIDGLQKKYCRPEYYDGTKLSENIFRSFISDYELPDLNQYTKLQYESFSLESFF